MESIDLRYICSAINRLSSVPVRIYDGGVQVFFQSVFPLPVDPIRPYEKRILASPDKVGYLITEDFDFYGLVRHGRTSIVIGPSRQSLRTPQELQRLAFDLDIPRQEVPQFIAAVGAILPLPLDFMLEILCMVNHVLCGEKLQLRDLRVTDLLQTTLSTQITAEQVQSNFEAINESKPNDVYRAHQVEQELLGIVQSGDIEKLEEWAANTSAVRAGQTSSNALQQDKNIFTATVTLVSRAAIQGGMDLEDAIRLSDSYIRKCDRLSSLEEIGNLQYHMVHAFTEQVARILDCGAQSALARRVAAYVRRHLSEPIHTEDLARALFLSRGHLSTKFKKEQGMDLTAFIRQVKINEARHLLQHTDKSLLTISSYLGFSSQSHFSRAFKAMTGESPGDYRRHQQVVPQPTS